MAHWLSIGGTLGGVTTDIFSEGLQIPILKIQSQGKLNDDLIEIIKMNCQLPHQAMGDLRAQLTAVRSGEKRFLEMVNRYGVDEVLGSIDAIMDAQEKAARERTRSIPDGTYEAESFMDDDALEIGKRIPIKVKVIVAGDRMTIDLSDVSRQVRGFYNSGFATGLGAAQVAYKCIAAPTDYPITDGSFRSLDIVLPPGRVVSAIRPAPLRVWMTIPMTIIDTVFKALLPAIPRPRHRRALRRSRHRADLRLRARSSSSSSSPPSGPTGGGWGAKMTEDGVSATVCINDGDTHSAPVELLETKYPIYFDRYALIQDSGGAGPEPRRARRRVRGAHAPRAHHAHQYRARALPALGARRRRAGHRQPCLGDPLGRQPRPTTPTPRSSTRGSSPATGSSSSPAAAAGSARPGSGRRRRCAKTCARAMSASQPPKGTMAWCCGAIDLY